MNDLGSEARTTNTISYLNIILSVVSLILTC